MPETCRPSSRRAVAIIAFVVALLILGSFALWVLQITASGSSSYLSHLTSMGAFYAAESGIEMALREVSVDEDIDSDGTIGTISNNAVPADDPTLTTGSFSVSAVADVYTATGRWRGYRRVLEAEAE